MAQAALAVTRTLRGMNVSDIDAVFYPGGHGPLWYLAEDAQSIALIVATLAAGKPVAGAGARAERVARGGIQRCAVFLSARVKQR